MSSFNPLAQVTVNVIGASPIERFCPTFLDLQGRQVRVLAGVPPDANQKEAALEWAAKFGLAEYGLAYRDGDRIGLMLAEKGKFEFAVMEKAEAGWRLAKAAG